MALAVEQELGNQLLKTLNSLRSEVQACTHGVPPRALGRARTRGVCVKDALLPRTCILVPLYTVLDLT